MVKKSTNSPPTINGSGSHQPNFIGPFNGDAEVFITRSRCGVGLGKERRARPWCKLSLAELLADRLDGGISLGGVRLITVFPLARVVDRAASD